MARWYCDTVVPLYYGTLVLWDGGTVELWYYLHLQDIYLLL